MEDKINKLFGIFNDLKNQELFSLALTQIVSVYNDYPACLYQILHKTRTLLYSKVSDPRLRLDHSKLAAAIIERTYKIYVHRLEGMKDEIGENMFHFDPSLTDQVNQDIHQELIHDYEQIRSNVDLKSEQIDFKYLIHDEDVILGKDKKYLQRSIENRNRPASDDNRAEDILKLLGLSGNVNEVNLSRIKKILDGNDLEFNVESSSEEEEEQQQDEPLKKQVKNAKHFIINPFNIIYNKAVLELMNHKWQDRNASALIVKSIVRQPGFKYLGFRYQITKKEENIQKALYQALLDYGNDDEIQLSKLHCLLTRCCVVISMDRFADYKDNKTHMIIREAVCQASITLLQDQQYQGIWANDEVGLQKFIILMKEFILESQSARVYEVSQSALFLIHGLLEKRFEFVFDNFSQLFLEIGMKDNEDEILELLADIWKVFLRKKNEINYFQQVYKIILHQLKKVDDLCYACKSIFEFLACLFNQQVPQCNYGYELNEIYQRFFFHRISEVKQAFYKFLFEYFNKMPNFPDQNLLIQYLFVAYQNGLFEENIDTFTNLQSLIAIVANQLSEEMLENFLEHCLKISTELDCKNQIKQVSANLVQIHYPQLCSGNQNVDSLFYRMIKTAYLLKDVNIHIQLDDNIDPRNFILLIRNHLNQKSSSYTLKDVSGGFFDNLDLDIQIRMQMLNILLENYAQIETEYSYLQILHQFFKLYKEFTLAPAHSKSLRDLYINIFEQLRGLSALDYEMDSQSIQKLQDVVSQLVEKIKIFRRFSSELKLNLQVLVGMDCDCLIQRIKTDRYQIMQDLAAQRLVSFIVQNVNCCDLTLLYTQMGQSSATYILQSDQLLGQADYGRKKLMLLLMKNKFQWWSLYFERLFLTQIKLIQFQQDTQQNILAEPLKQNIWGLGMVSVVYGVYQSSEFNQWIQDLLSKLIQVAILLSKDQETNAIELNGTKFIFDEPIKTKPLSQQINSILVNFIYNLSKDKQVFDQTLIVVNSLIKQNQLIIYDIFTRLLKEHPAAFTAVSGFLTLRVIKHLTSPLPEIQSAANQLLGYLIPLLTLQSEIYQPISQKLLRKFAKAKEFQEGFGKMTQVKYQIDGLINPNILREYQFEGIRWLAFLVKYNLHGALCDDMGLGKTLQTLAVVATETAKRKSQNPISLVISPSTVVDHWNAECKKYIRSDVLNPGHNLILLSYQQMLKANQQFLDQNFFFLILDEAHILKNSRNKSSKIIRSIKAKHKVVLSGTPVQNHLLELWSLFDLLLPQYLGDEEYFKKHFSKAFHTNLFSLTDEEIMFDENQKQTLKHLHQKVLPFIMRRTKQDVLPQLPPKIIEDYYCQLSQPLQEKIYQILESNSLSNEVEQQLSKTSDEQQKNKICESIFKLLQKLRQVLDHPILIKTKRNYKKRVKTEQSELEINKIYDTVEDPESYIHSGKMLALKDILQQLGFATVDEAPTQNDQISILTNYNKVLIFSRFRAALALIVDQLLKPIFPGLQYLTLDGSVPQNQRYPIITKFNEDPDIRVLLLTTQVGGLGLNLSSANIVIMFDHDYNPVNDQQAMDRAHRIGQKNVVQVFRLIVKDTLEEKIMGIQRFKNAISKAIVNTDNASLKQMEKTDLLSMLEQQQQQQQQGKNKEEQQIEKITGSYAKILGQLKLDLLEQLNFDKEF